MCVKRLRIFYFPVLERRNHLHLDTCDINLVHPQAPPPHSPHGDPYYITVCSFNLWFTKQLHMCVTVYVLQCMLHDWIETLHC